MNAVAISVNKIAQSCISVAEAFQKHRFGAALLIALCAVVCVFVYVIKH